MFVGQLGQNEQCFDFNRNRDYAVNDSEKSLENHVISTPNGYEPERALVL